MGFFENLGSKFKESFDKRRQEKEQLDALRKQAEMEHRIIFEQEFKKNALEVAQAKAKQDAARLSGIQKLRAMNRARRLTETGQGENFLSKFSSYTQANLKRREENLARTEELRKAAEQMRQERTEKMKQDREENILRNQNRVGLAERKSSWRM